MLPVVPGAKRLYRAPAGTLPARGCALVLLHLPARLDEPCDQVLRNGLALLLGNDLTNTGSETSLVHGRAQEFYDFLMDCVTGTLQPRAPRVGASEFQEFLKIQKLR